MRQLPMPNRILPPNRKSSLIIYDSVEEDIVAGAAE